jgi:hypothetical protein
VSPTVKLVLDLSDRDLTELDESSGHVVIADVSQDGVSAGEPHLETDALVSFSPLSHRDAKVDLFGFPMLEVPVQRRERGNDFASVLFGESGSKAQA